MVLLSFAAQELADSFYNDFNGLPFSSLEPDILCRCGHLHPAGMRHEVVVITKLAVLTYRAPANRVNVTLCPFAETCS